MKPYIRLVSCLGGVLIVTGLFGWPHLREAVRRADDQSSLFDDLRRLQSARRHSDVLDARWERMRRWQEQKREVVSEVIAGRMTLLQAAARFRELDDQRPDFNWDLFRDAWPGRSDGERHCRHLIASVEAALCERPLEAAAVAACLEAELQELLQRDGTIQLPEPPR